MSSFKSNENIHKKEDGSNYVVSANKDSSVTKAREHRIKVKETCEYIRGSAISSGPRQANLVLIAYASSEGSGEPAHPRSLARTFAARSYKQ